MIDSNTGLEKIGRYNVIRELGRGGMGVVYLAQDDFIERMVAIKAVSYPGDPSSDGPQIARQAFFNEARAAGKLHHPHIVSIHDAMWEDDMGYLVMEYVDGMSLKAHIPAGGIMPLESVMKHIFQCAKALNYAHQNGIIHRDIKPNNILISANGDAKLSDFGIAVIDGASVDPLGNHLTGSVHYLAPELMSDRNPSPGSDIFSLGVVLFEALTGVKPFQADSDVAVAYKISHEETPPLNTFRRDVPPLLERILNRMLEKKAEKRYQTGLQVASDLSHAFDHLRFLDENIDTEEKFNVLKKLHFFKHFKSAELSEVLKVTTWLKYEAAETIITEGEIEDCFYIIVSGEVRVFKRGKPLAVLKAGDCFGEMAYLGKMTRTATIEAIKDTVLMKVNASIIDQTSTNTQFRFYKVFSSTLIERLTRTSERLSSEI